MSDLPYSSFIARTQQVKGDFVRFVLEETPWGKGDSGPETCDFIFGNPHEMPLAEISEAMRKWAVPQDPGWFAYKTNEPQAQQAVAASLRQRFGVEFEPADVALTPGAFGGLAVVLRCVLDPGDEVIFNTPCWFSYDTLTEAAGGSSIRVPSDPPDFDLPVEGIASAITERTRAVIVNSPHNPTGRVYDPDSLSGLGEVLRESSRRNGRTIYLISDESYNRIIYDDREFPTPTSYYEASFLIYTYGKTLLTPGQRLGYVAMPPAMPLRPQLRAALFTAQIATGWAFPNAVMQYLLADIEKLSIDIKQLQSRRDRMVEGLLSSGYELASPEGTFYLLVRSPIEDDLQWARRLNAAKVYVLPGRYCEIPGYFRISLTATDDMVERSLPIFTEVLSQTR